MNNIVLVGRAVVNDGPCVEYEKLLCHAGSNPDPGDLVIVLPDDDASLAETTPYRRGRTCSSPMRLVPTFRHGYFPWLTTFHVASNDFAQKKFPDRRLDASVTLW
jgi:hypothetical protein